MKPRILVWDLPTRLFHWSLALSFAGAYLTAESERWRDVHVTLGYVVLGLLVFRLFWGFMGSRYARFAEFVRGPSAIRAYLSSLTAGRPTHYTGHNPLGAVAILLLIGLGLASSVSGWLLYAEVGGESLEDALEELHEVLSNGMLAVVVLHIAGVIHGSFVHRENLAWAMLTGHKQGAAEQAIPSTRPWAALALMAGVLAIVAWDRFDSAASEGTEAPYLDSELELEDDDEAVEIEEEPEDND
ncbi:cytochrome b/b6 domain-containing protein [Methylotetracoccus oryzae]|uniref:cytochrome b/b6 domain-containing protein n=1 Tax=Methylotetracoccus oryzae TaxID=1919059 RepID=UPI00111AAAE6|nr:cytochrome b/b6 domain-containing protein [Methylotetracoccus oryzae]